MLDHRGFDLWADGYDRSTGLSDEDGSYPFAGYKALLGRIYDDVLTQGCRTVLDIGFGTAVITSALYQRGCRIYGQDFSEKMLAIAREKMPDAALYAADFTQSLAFPLRQQKYDAIIATYSLHHLTDEQKPPFIRELLSHLNEGGRLFIGDIAFPDRPALTACRAAAGSDWDEEEVYFVFDEFRLLFPGASFEPFSHCAGLITLK